MSLKRVKNIQLTFSLSQQQLVNSGNKTPYPKTFYNLNFQLKHLNRSICTRSLHKYVFKKSRKRSGNTGDNILSFLLKCSHWVSLNKAF